MLWRFAAAFLVLAVGLGIYVISEPGELEEHFGGDWSRGYELAPNGPEGAWLRFPGPKTDLDDVRKMAYETCSTEGVAPLARALETRAHPEAVARRYAQQSRYSGRSAVVYEECLRGFGQ